MTRRQLAQASGASERYLAQIEGGAGNPSVIMLASIAQALDVPIIELLPRSNGRTAAMAQILDVLARTPRAELPALAELRSEEHTSELQSLRHLVCRLLLEKKKKKTTIVSDEVI